MESKRFSYAVDGAQQRRLAEMWHKMHAKRAYCWQCAATIKFELAEAISKAKLDRTALDAPLDPQQDHR